LIENTLTEMASIDQMQIIQHSPDDMVSNIVPGNQFTDSSQAALSKYFKTVFPETSVAINKVEEILPEPSGKYRFSICRIPEMK
jgi:phenylacetate-CoA ligase